MQVSKCFTHKPTFAVISGRSELCNRTKRLRWCVKTSMAFTLKGCVRHPDVSTQEVVRLQDVSIQEVVGHLDVSTGLHSGACKTQDVSTHDVKHPVVSTLEVVKLPRRVHSGSCKLPRRVHSGSCKLPRRVHSGSCKIQDVSTSGSCKIQDVSTQEVVRIKTCPLRWL